MRLLQLIALLGLGSLLVAPDCKSDTSGGAGSEGMAGNGGTAGSGGVGGTTGTDPCVVDQECNPFEISDCDTPCIAFCGPGGTEIYGTCGTNVDPSMPPPGGKYYCECHCYTEECP